jgi:hypothetical protein
VDECKPLTVGHAAFVRQRAAAATAAARGVAPGAHDAAEKEYDGAPGAWGRGQSVAGSEARLAAAAAAKAGGLLATCTHQLLNRRTEPASLYEH